MTNLSRKIKDLRLSGAGSKKSVRGFVLEQLNVILEAKALMTWDQIAIELEKDGLKWGNGNRVTGTHLRVLVSRYLKQSNRTQRQALRLSEKRSEHISVDKDGPDKPRISKSSMGQKEKNAAILAEIERATKERKWRS